ncbi:hypothetical protein CAPTEDRAFT_110292, partial [Capitella teleta]
NIMVIICVSLYKPMHKPHKVNAISLAVADHFVGLSGMLGMMIVNIYRGIWPLPPFVCTLVLITDSVCGTVLMFHICLIVHNRFKETSIRYRTDRGREPPKRK